jgi:hypothetical protein
MATTEGETPTTLREQIEAFQAQMAGRRPPEALAAFADNTAALVASGIAERALQVGERAPDFTLPDALGRPVTLSRLLEQGPAVVTFTAGHGAPTAISSCMPIRPSCRRSAQRARTSWRSRPRPRISH